MSKRDKWKLLWVEKGIFCATIIVFVLLLLMGNVLDANKFQQQDGLTDAKPYIEVSPFNGKQVLVGDVVAEWLKGETDGEELYNRYSAAGRVYSTKSVMINYMICDIPVDVEVTDQLVELSEKSTFEKAIQYELGGNKRSVRFDYLMTDKTYYYRIKANLSDGTQISKQGKFETANTPRLISVEGVWNMRDIGGARTVNGKTTKQGMIYRGVELDGAVYERYRITEEAAEILTKQLNIKFEADLRAPNEKIKDMLGPNVQHNIYGVYAYVEGLIPHYSESYRKLFADLANEDNYPMYVHCTYGKDRTGTVCYLLQLLLGVSEEDAFKEWELSVLLDGKVDYDSMEKYISALKALDGDTMQEKVENHLISFGVTKKEIESIKRILIEDYEVSESP